jgi:hypothetical protein
MGMFLTSSDEEVNKRSAQQPEGWADIVVAGQWVNIFNRMIDLCLFCYLV